MTAKDAATLLFCSGHRVDIVPTSAPLNQTFFTPVVARLSPRLSCSPLTTALGTILHPITAPETATRRVKVQSRRLFLLKECP